MIIVNFSGGLGNQIFQYACGKSLSLALNMDVKFVTDHYESEYYTHKFELDKVFDIELPLASKGELKELFRWLPSSQIARKFIRKFAPNSKLLPSNLVFEGNCNLVENLEERLKFGGYLHGYWQSDYYFKKFQDNIRSDLTFIDFQSLEVMSDSTPKVSLHVRRGDYLNHLNTYVMCDRHYYASALKSICPPGSDFHLVIFSDDPDWAESELSFLHSDTTIVRGNDGPNSFKDMCLMAQCDHHIIANSSFSWWGAWLNNSKKKRVVAPRNWFVDTGLSQSHIVPDSWTRI